MTSVNSDNGALRPLSESSLGQEFAEKRLLDTVVARLLSKWEPKDKVRTLKVRMVLPDVFILWTDRIISTFYTGKGEVILNLNSIRRAHYFQKASYLAGYREIPSDTGPVELYRIRDIDGKGNPVPGAKPLDKFSYEYYVAFTDISFYDDKLIVETFRKPDAVDKSKPGDQPTYSKMEDELLLSLAKKGALRIRDLVVFKETGQTTDSGYHAALEILRKNLLATIGDYRFERINDGVTKKELDSYLKEDLISPDLHLSAVRKLERVEKLRKEIDGKRSEETERARVRIAEFSNEGLSA